MMISTIDLEGILEAFQNGESVTSIGEIYKLSKSTVDVILRRAGAKAHRDHTDCVERVLAAHMMDMSRRDAAEFSGVDQSHVTRIWQEHHLIPGPGEVRHYAPGSKMPRDGEVMRRRRDILDDYGLEEKLFAKWISNETFCPVKRMRGSVEFFLNLQADIHAIFGKYPMLISFGWDVLEEKRAFYEEEIGIARKTLLRLPALFTYRVDRKRQMIDNFATYFKDRKLAIAMFRKKPGLFGYRSSTLLKKMRRYSQEGCDYHQNYTLLELDVDNVIDGFRLLRKENVLLDDGMLFRFLAIGGRQLRKKMMYLEDKNIEWKEYPRILYLGLGTEGKPGTLPRRIALIDNTFGEDIPVGIDYRQNPKILAYTDLELRDFIDRRT
jgi:hypothetical protein